MRMGVSEDGGVEVKGKMRGPGLTNWANLAMSSVLVFSMFWSDCACVQSMGQETRSAEVEAEIYKQWYNACKDRLLPRVIELGEGYLHAYPEGKYAAYLSHVMDFARISLDPGRESLAQKLRSQVRKSISNREELGSLLTELLNERGDTNLKSNTGQTPLMLAAFDGDSQSVKALLQKHVDLDAAESSHGWTALVYAIWGGDHSLVSNLLEYDPDAGIKDKKGRTAMDHAIATGDFEMMLLVNGRPHVGHSAHQTPK